MPHVRLLVDQRPAWPAHAACGDDLSLHSADSGIEMELGGERLGRKLNAGARSGLWRVWARWAWDLCLYLLCPRPDLMGTDPERRRRHDQD